MLNPYDRANQILDTHVPTIGAARDIVAKHLPFMDVGNRLIAGADPVSSRRSGGSQDPVVGRAAVPRGVVASPLGQAIASDAAATQQAGGVVDINTWAHGLDQAGVAAGVIRTAYDGAGGDPELSSEERSGDTSRFLASFVSGLEQQGVSSSVIVATYQQAGGAGGPSSSGGRPSRGFGGTVGHEAGQLFAGAEKVGQGAIDAVSNAVHQVGKLFGI